MFKCLNRHLPSAPLKHQNPCDIRNMSIKSNILFTSSITVIVPKQFLISDLESNDVSEKVKFNYKQTNQRLANLGV